MLNYQRVPGYLDGPSDPHTKSVDFTRSHEIPWKQAPLMLLLKDLKKNGWLRLKFMKWIIIHIIHESKSPYFCWNLWRNQHFGGLSRWAPTSSPWFFGTGGRLQAPAPTAAGGGFARQRLGATAGSQGLAEAWVASNFKLGKNWNL